MTKRKETYRRLSHNKADGSYWITISPEIINSNNWEKGQTLYLRNYEGVLRYGDVEDPKAKKLKIQYQKSINLYSVRVPYKTVEQREGWKVHQQFSVRSGSGTGSSFVIFDPYVYIGSKTLIGVSEPKKTVCNLPSQSKEVTDLAKN